MRKLVVSIFLIVASVSGITQNVTVQGRISDTLDKKNLSNAVISLIQKKDSLLYNFTRSRENGDFIIKNVVPGSYKLLITYPRFADYTDDIEVKDKPVDLNIIALTQKSASSHQSF